MRGAKKRGVGSERTEQGKIEPWRFGAIRKSTSPISLVPTASHTHTLKHTRSLTFLSFHPRLPPFPSLTLFNPFR